MRQLLPTIFKTSLYSLVSIDENGIWLGVVGQEAEGRLGIEPCCVWPAAWQGLKKPVPHQATEAAVEQGSKIRIAGKVWPGRGEPKGECHDRMAVEGMEPCDRLAEARAAE